MFFVWPLLVGFDASKFRTRCAESPACASLRPAQPAYQPSGATFELADAPALDGNTATVQLLDGANGTASLVLHATGADVPVWTVRITTERNEFRIAPLMLPSTSSSPAPSVELHYTSYGLWALRTSSAAWWSELEVRGSPFELRLFTGREGTPRAPDEAAVAVVNGHGLLRFGGCSERPDAWGGFVDSRPDGCTALGADVFFPGALEAFGLPERAMPLALPLTMAEVRRASITPAGKATSAAASDGDSAAARPTFASVREPYRLFNLDVFKYGPGTPVGLYGSLPYLLAHGRRRAAGVLWLSAAETYVDLWRGEATQTSAQAAGDGSGGAAAARGGGGLGAGTGSHWVSEAGALELALFGGPSAAHVLRQLAAHTGPAPLPPVWAMGYHQSHWNVKSQAQAEALDRNFDRHGVPLDVVWLDIEHTVGKRYFTFDADAFPSPEALHAQLAPKGRRVVGIADPHLKADPAYEIHARALAEGWLVRAADGGSFVGECWPGQSSYLDLLQPAARAFWSSLYRHGPQGDGASFGASSATMAGARQAALGWPTWMHAWNDMNEPSVFDSAELTLPRDATHELPAGWDGQPPAVPSSSSSRRSANADKDASAATATAAKRVEHRLVHNAYGALQARATFEGMQARPGAASERPFVLSRAFFIGSQRHGAVWTGDNTASWE